MRGSVIMRSVLPALKRVRRYAYHLAMEVLRCLGAGLAGSWAGAGGRVPREDRGDADEIVAAAFEALKTTIRLGGSGNGLAH